MLTIQEGKGDYDLDATSDCSYIVTSLAESSEYPISGRYLQQRSTFLKVFEKGEEEFGEFQEVALSTSEPVQPRMTSNGSHIVVGDSKGTSI